MGHILLHLYASTVGDFLAIPAPYPAREKSIMRCIWMHKSASSGAVPASLVWYEKLSMAYITNYSLKNFVLW